MWRHVNQTIRNALDVKSERLGGGESDARGEDSAVTVAGGAVDVSGVGPVASSSSVGMGRQTSRDVVESPAPVLGGVGVTASPLIQPPTPEAETVAISLSKSLGSGRESVW